MRFPLHHTLLGLTLSGPFLLHAEENTAQLDKVVVSGSEQSALFDSAQPATVLSADDIQGNSGDTLGTLLERLPGISNASFGPGVGRPVVRGMSGSRVKILQNGSDSSDLSAMSSDHATMTEASVAEQVEVIHGPAALIYGDGSIGGVVNLIDNRIHEQPRQGVHGQVNARVSSNDNGYNLSALMDAGKGDWTLHLDGFDRSSENYRSGDEASTPAGSNGGDIANSDSQGTGGALALSWADGERGFAGISLSTLDYDYGVPNTDGEDFRVKPQQTRLDVKGGWRPAADSALNWIEEWRLELSHNDYQHDETDGDLVVGLFDQQSYELSSRLSHSFGRWSGTLGIQVKQQELALCHNHAGCDSIPSYPQLSWDGSMGTNFTSVTADDGTVYVFAHDTPMPETTSTDIGVFMVEQRDWSQGVIELGARLDQRTIESDPSVIRPAARQAEDYYDDKVFTPLTLSASATWVMNDEQRFGLSLARVQRAPDAQSLFWNGDHHATFAFQLDNPDLGVETAITTELNWMLADSANEVKVSLYHYHFNDYIYNNLQSVTDPFHDEAVYRHEQADARFSGAEFSWAHQLTHSWSADLNSDYVRASLADGGDLPRTPPASLRLGINWQNNGWQARAETHAVASQKRVADNETATGDYMLLNASLQYRQFIGTQELNWRLALNNISDEYATNHVSYLKYAAPLAGRNIQAGVNWRF